MSSGDLLRYSFGGELRGSRCGTRSGPSLGFRPGGAGVRRLRLLGDFGLAVDRLGIGATLGEIARQLVHQPIPVTDLLRLGGFELFQQRLGVIGRLAAFLQTFDDVFLSRDAMVALGNVPQRHDELFEQSDPVHARIWPSCRQASNRITAQVSATQ